MSNNRTVPIIILSIALLVAVYLPCGSAASTYIMDETFDGAIPSGWTQVRYSGTGLWQWSDDTSSAYKPLNSEDGYLIADSDGNGGDVYDVGLFTPSMDMTGLTSVQIAFDKNFQVFGYQEGRVATYSGGTGVGNLEEQLGFWDVDDPDGGEHVSYNINPSTYADPSDVYVEFWYSTLEGTWKWSFSIDNLQIDGDSSLSVTLSVDDVDHCSGTIDVSAEASGGTAPYSYAWDIDGDGYDDGTGASTTLDVGYGYSGTIRVQVTDDDSNHATDDDSASTNAQLDVEITTFDINHCPGTIHAVALASGGDGSYTYDWDLDNDGVYDVLDTGAEVTLNPGYGSADTAVVRVTDGNVCTASESQAYSINNQLTVSLSVGYQNTGSATFTAAASGGDGSYTYYWDLDGDCAYETMGTLTNTQAVMGTGASGTAYVRVIDGKGCWTTAFVGYEIESASWSPAVLKPLVSVTLDKTNAMWFAIVDGMPGEVPENAQMMLEEIQACMGNVAMLSNPVYANGELNRTIVLIEELATLLA